MKTTRISFTLLEVMVTIAILAILASVVGIQAKRLIDHHRFERQLLELFSTLQEAQTLACAYQTDLSLEVFERKGHLYYQFSTDEPFSSLQISQGERKLTGVKAVFLNDHREKRAHIDIYAGGRVSPPCRLKFSDLKTDSVIFDLRYGYLTKFCKG